MLVSFDCVGPLSAACERGHGGTQARQCVENEFSCVMLGRGGLREMDHTATQCNTLQHAVTHCNILQHTAGRTQRTRRNARHGSHFNTPQHAVTHCGKDAEESAAVTLQRGHDTHTR